MDDWFWGPVGDHTVCARDTERSFAPIPGPMRLLVILAVVAGVVRGDFLRADSVLTAGVRPHVGAVWPPFRPLARDFRRVARARRAVGSARPSPRERGAAPSAGVELVLPGGVRERLGVEAGAGGEVFVERGL